MRTALLLIPAAMLLAGCGTSEIKQHGAEQVIVNVVARQTGFRPMDVKCPSGIEAKAGATFDCHFTGPDGPYVAHMRVTSVHGPRVVFDVHTLRLAKSAA